MGKVCLTPLVLLLIPPGLDWSLPRKAGRAAPPRTLSRAEQALVNGNNEFALALYARLARSTPAGDDLFFSPYSVSAALAMSYGGARGTTAERMAKTMHFSLNPERLATAFAALGERLGKRGPPRPGIGLRVCKNDGGGVRIQEVVEGGAAYAVGLKPGDVIVSVCGQSTDSPTALVAAMEQAGARVSLRVKKGGAGQPVTVDLGQDRAGTGRARHGATGYQLHLANALWGQKGMTFCPGFVRTARAAFRAEVLEADFTTEGRKARDRINDWVARQTNGKVHNLVTGELALDTELVLVNAVYFQAAWSRRFSKEATRPQPFQVTSHKRVEVPMMSQVGNFRVMKGRRFRALELPYAGGELALLVLLPERPDGLAEVEKGLTAARLARCVEQLHAERVEVHLPRFRIASALDLKEHLSALGIGLAFSPRADFSGLACNKQVRLSAAVHSARVAVDEDGTEAAAATAVVLERGLAASVFRADHPFLIVLRDLRTGSILFLGRVVQPRF